MGDADTIPTTDQVLRLVRAFVLIESPTVRERIIEQVEDLSTRVIEEPTIQDTVKSSH